MRVWCFTAGFIAASLLGGCASTADVEPLSAGLEVCAEGICGPAKGRYAQDELLGGLLVMFKRNERVTHTFCEFDDKTGRCGNDHLRFFAQGGPIPAPGSISNPIYDNVYFEWSKRQLGFRLDADVFWVGPVFCGDSDSVITVSEKHEVLIESNFACTWTLFPTFWNLKLAVDRIDFDTSTLAGRWAMGGGGLLNGGGGSGKFIFKLANENTLASAGSAAKLASVGDLPGDFMVSLAPAPKGGDKRPEPPKTASRPPPPAAPESQAAASQAEKVPPVIAAPERLKAEGPVIDFTGTISDNSAIVEFSVDGTPMLLGADGGFAVRRAVPIGETDVVLAAVDTWGNRAERKVRVSRAPAQAAVAAASQDSRPPAIEAPREVETAGREVEFGGRVTDESSIFEVRADGAAVQLADDGRFVIRRPVPLGDSVLKLAAVDRWGNRTEHAVAVKRRAPQAVAAAAQAPPDSTPPAIEVAPKVFATGIKASIAGKVSSKSPLYSLSIGGAPVKPAPDGSFREERYAPLGTSRIDIVAVDVWGNKAEKAVLVERSTEAAEPARLPPLNPTRVAAAPRPDAVALIVGIENYRAAPRAEFAENDAKVFFDYATRALGVPATRVKLLTNEQADALSVFKAVDLWVRANTQKGKSDVYLFFAGHGLASPDGSDAYLLPYDGDTNYIERTAIRRSELLEALNRSGARSATVMLDTCYSGSGRGGETLVASARPVLIKALDQDVPASVSLLSAAGGDEISSGLAPVRHGLFSYFLMRALEGEADAAPWGNSDRTLTLGELRAYLVDNVGRQAAELGRSQTPQLQGDPERVIARW